MHVSHAYQVQPQALSVAVTMGFVHNQAVIAQNVHSYLGVGLSMPSDKANISLVQNMHSHPVLFSDPHATFFIF